MNLKLYYLFSALCVAMASENTLSQSAVTRIYTDHNGFLTSSSSSIQSPDPTTQNLLAFQTAGGLWSTGVNDATLVSNGVFFTPMNFQAMPATSVGASSSALIGIGRSFGGYIGSNGCSPSVAAPHGNNISGYLTDGPHGLDISTGVFNVGGSLNYTVANIQAASIGDGIPDIIVTQIGDLSGSIFDSFRFKTAGNTTVGNQVSVNFSGVPTVMRPYWKFYNLSNLACGASASGTRDTRVLAFDFADLGITVSNYVNIAKFEHILTPNSDVAFVAYNTVSVTILPITLTKFGAELINREVELNWQTASEQNSDYFLVERSVDGITWESVASVEAAGNSSEQLNYQVYDKQPYTNKSYYRLKLVDADGIYTMSSIVLVNMDETALSVFPNPVNDRLSIEGKSIGEILVFDIAGKDVTKEISILNESSNFVQLDLSKLKQGIYFLNCNRQVYQIVRN